MENQAKRYLKSIMRCVSDCVAAAVTPRLYCVNNWISLF